MPPVPPPIVVLYNSPATPDLGRFVRNKHPFEVDDEFFIWNEFAPFNSTGQYIPHQVYFRVKYGQAAYHQRVRVWMTPPNSDPPPLIGLPPDYVLGGAFLPTPSDWQKFSVRSGNTDYWFAGEHKPPQDTVWQRDAAVGHSFDIYDNGTLSTVGWDDTGGDRDFNDIVLEVAVVYRHNFFDDLKPFAVSAKEAERFKNEILPKIHASKKARRASAE